MYHCIENVFQLIKILNKNWCPSHQTFVGGSHYLPFLLFLLQRGTWHFFFCYMLQFWDQDFKKQDQPSEISLGVNSSRLYFLVQTVSQAPFLPFSSIGGQTTKGKKKITFLLLFLASTEEGGRQRWRERKKTSSLVLLPYWEVKESNANLPQLKMTPKLPGSLVLFFLIQY